jgi:alkyl hydroperoxide reductase subunit AhpC
MVKLNAPAPDVALDATADGQVRRIRLSDFRGRCVVLFFYPADFTFVYPTEIRGFQARRDDFARRDCEILGVSVAFGVVVPQGPAPRAGAPAAAAAAGATAPRRGWR